MNNKLLLLFTVILITLSACGRSSSASLTHSGPAAIESAVGLSAQTQNTTRPSFLEESFNSPYITSHKAHSLAKINTLVSSKNGSIVYSGASNGTLVRSEMKSGGVVTTETLLESSGAILDIALSPSERYLAISQYSSIVVYNLVLKKVEARMSRINGRIVQVAWDPKEEIIAAGLATGELYVWNVFRGKSARKNSRKAIERYEIYGVSSVVGLAFHPKGGALIVAERVGEIKLWRLLRRDEELGLRDPTAFVDREREGKKNVLIAKVANTLEGISLSADGSMLFAADSKGLLHSWKLKGLKAIPAFEADRSGLFEVKAFSIVDRRTSDIYKLLATTGREQNIKFWCQTNEDTIKEVEVIVGESPKFESPISVMDISALRPRLWAVEKTGSLIGFRVEEMLRLQSLRQCL